MSLTLVAVFKREDVIALQYGEADDDPNPFVRTVTSHHVANETSKSLPLSGLDVQAYILNHARKLRTTAEECRAQGLNSEVLL
jgi:hypothetical protein